jgi:hypothetical protein
MAREHRKKSFFRHREVLESPGPRPALNVKSYHHSVPMDLSGAMNGMLPGDRLVIKSAEMKITEKFYEENLELCQFKWLR